jgi:chromosome segregation ATPase
MVKLETFVFQRFYDRKRAEMSVEDEERKKGFRQKMKKNVPTTLTADQKYDISIGVHEDLLLELEKNRKTSEKMIDTLRAVLEETEIRIGELKRDAYEFKRDIVVGAENARTGKIMAEKVARYFEEKLKTKDSIIEKLRLKNASLKAQITKVENQLNQKEEVGDALHYIDFHQLQIENKQYIAKIEEKNEELLTVKLATGKATQVLNDLKKRLVERSNESQWLDTETQNKTRQLARLRTELKKLDKIVRSEGKLSTKLKQQINDASEMPNIEDYIMQKKEMYELQAQIKNWQKKLDIAEMTVKKNKNLLKTAKKTNVIGL